MKKKLEQHELESIGDLLDPEALPFTIDRSLALRSSITEWQVKDGHEALVCFGVTRRDNRTVCEALNAIPKLLDHIAYLNDRIEQLENKLNIHERRRGFEGANPPV